MKWHTKDISKIDAIYKHFYCNRSCILNEEDSFPSNLGPKIFQVQPDVFNILSRLITQVVPDHLVFVFQRNTLRAAYREVKSGLVKNFQAEFSTLFVVHRFELRDFCFDLYRFIEVKNDLIITVEDCDLNCH